PSTTLCVAVDAGGNVLTSTSPTSGSWTTANIDPYTALNSVSCPSTTLCVATDVNGDVFTTTNPTGGASAWTEHNVEGTGSFLTVACATTSLCLLTDDVGNVLTSTAPTSGAWSAAAIDPGVALSQASCVSASLCLIGDAHGDVVFSTNPTGGRGAWSMADVDGTISLDALSCPSSALCVGADGYGNVVTTTSPTAAQGSLSYSDTNNADGNITTETDAANGSTADSVTYGYTANVQVSSSSASGIPHDSGSFAYDTAAEPTTIVNPSSGASDTQSFNSADELTSSVTSGTTTTYAEDSIGARTSSTVGSGSPSAYSYNQIGELVSAVPSGGSTYTYAYNGDGLRMSKTVSSTTESYTWDPISGNLLVDGSTNFLYGPNGVVEQEDGTSTGDPLYFVQDSQGSTRALLNQSGAVAGTYSYDTYGAIASHSGSSSTPIGYVGAYSDTETDFLYLVNRYYDPATGQFLSVDSLVDETGQPYAYTGDDPVNGVDPLGLCTVKGEGQLYPGACATTGAEAIAAEQEIQAQAGGGGFSITNGLKALANYGAGIGNGIVSTATFGQVHISAPYCNSLSWAYGVGSGFGYAIAAVGGGAAASAAAGSTTVGDLAYGSQSLGPDSALFGNDTLGETADSGLLNQRGSTWKVGWSVDATVSPTSPGFRISTPFIDHWWITHASGF
ncbi:MAG TPA: RHS repeat-associated core domain-containing protein, partial [Acidimicrobiales bacterium]|nr:RHS repeat-associated core domain-containing protein [Acidimicrobiales bacterium]